MVDRGGIMSTSTSIQESIRAYLEQYFGELGGKTPENVYQMMLELIERPMLEEVMKKAGNNQCRATRYLGLARGTVIKKLKQYEIITPKARAMAQPKAAHEFVTIDS
jgi:Fis family transcriptional regulator, factor for inversion stimulation protein